VKINGGRLALNGLAADGRFIDFTDGGPLILENVLFGDVPDSRFRIRAHAAEPGSMLLALGNVFPNDSPFDLNGRCRLIAFGNRGVDGSGRPVPLDDEVSAGGDAEGRLTLSTVGSISATGRKRVIFAARSGSPRLRPAPPSASRRRSPTPVISCRPSCRRSSVSRPRAPVAWQSRGRALPDSRSYSKKPLAAATPSGSTGFWSAKVWL